MSREDYRGVIPRRSRGSEKKSHLRPAKATKRDCERTGWKLLGSPGIIQAEKQRRPPPAPSNSIKRCRSLGASFLNSANAKQFGEKSDNSLRTIRRRRYCLLTSVGRWVVHNTSTAVAEEDSAFRRIISSKILTSSRPLRSQVNASVDSAAFEAS